jgi:hypothetical protein
VEWVFNHDDKQNIIQEHFENTMADPPPRICDFPWPHMQFQMPDLSSLV